MQNSKFLIIISLFTLGFVFLYIDLYQRMLARTKPQRQIIYRYLPDTRPDELGENIFPSDVFATMFSQPSPWIHSGNDLDTRQKDKINQYFISQI